MDVLESGAAHELNSGEKGVGKCGGKMCEL